jgi:D-alanyl-D-alanine carboxypeptidase
LNGVGALSGYATTLAGEDLVFSIMVNHHPGAGADEVRQDIDALVLLFAGLEQPRAVW